MSEFGASIKATRVDGLLVDQMEAKFMASTMKRIAAEKSLQDALGGELVCAPAYETDGGFLFTVSSSGLYKGMTPEMMQDHLAQDMEIARTIVSGLVEAYGSIYTFEVSTSEW